MSDKTRLFGTAGIRGLTNIEITPQFALDLGNAYAFFLNKNGKVAVAHDTRYGALTIQQSIIIGLTSNGIEVEDCGCIPTPTLASYIEASKLAGGAMVTGSHLEPKRLGLIFFQPDGACLSRVMEEEVEKLYAARKWEKERLSPEFIGRVTQSATAPFIHRDRVLNLLPTATLDKIKNKKYRILLDPCNGTSAGFFAGVLKDLGCEVFEINQTPSAVPSRGAEPIPENLKETARKVLEHGCDLGAAFDTDADRVVFIDSKANIILNDNIAAIFAAEIFKKERGICVTPINASALIEWVCAKYRSEVEYCRVGAPAIAELIKFFQASFGYEETGKYFFPPSILWPDALVATVKLLAILAARGQTLAQLQAQFPTFYQKKQSIQCSDEHKAQVMNKISELWKEKEEKTLKIVDVDGIKKIYPDSSWLLIRASGTEPLIRIFSEASSSKRAQELLELGIDLVSKSIGD